MLDEQTLVLVVFMPLLSVLVILTLSFCIYKEVIYPKM